MNKLLKALTSLRLTVICLCFAIALVFIGTIAQVDEGLYQAQNRYFRSLLIWWSPNSHVSLPVFPGGYLVGGLLLANLIASHITRFKFTKNKIGILITHFGLILLLLGQFATDLFSRESQMRLTEGESKNYSEAFREIELAIVDTSASDSDKVYAIADTLVANQKSIESPKLPFALRIKNYYPNAMAYTGEEQVVPPKAAKTEANVGEFQSALVLPIPVTNDPERRNVPGAIVELFDNGKSLGTFFLWAGVNPQTFTANGKSYEIGLRFEREYYPFNLTLLKATHEKYKGTDIPKNFASRVRIENPEKHEARETMIYMNNPLRYAGLTFFQYQMEAEEMHQVGHASSTFQVVRNPSWLTPYLACVLVALGLVIQFMTHLLNFAMKRRAPAAKSTPKASKQSSEVAVQKTETVSA